ncbi:MAG: ABC transporter permease [Bacillota bacterium]
MVVKRKDMRRATPDSFSFRKYAVRRFVQNRGAVLGLLLFVSLIVSAVLAPWIAPYDPYEVSSNRLARPSREHPLGTDALGRDVLSRILYGGRISLQVGVIAVGIAAVTGTVLGLIAGYFEGWLDHVIMRLMEVMLAFPGILLAMAIIAVLGSGLFNVMIAVGIASVPSYTRLVRGVTLSVKQNEYVQAARALGSGTGRIMLRHLVPNIAAPIVVLSTLGVASAILTCAGLSFIGLGAPPPTAEWGAMLAADRVYLRRAWWVVAFPGLAITISVLAINLLGDGLRDALDPRLK